MNLFTGKIRLLGLLACSLLLSAALLPQSAGAASSAALLKDMKEIVASPGFWGGNAFALGKDGTVWAWGSNINGQLANGAAGPEGWTITPQRLPGLDHTRQLVAGAGYYLALKEDGTVMIWGKFLQDNTVQPDNKQYKVVPPQPLSGMNDIASMTSVTGGLLALKKNGTVMEWLAPEYSNTGYTEIEAAHQVTGISDVNSVDGGLINTAVRKNGTLWIWASSAQSKYVDLSQKPAQVQNLYHVTATDAADGSLIVLTESGSVWASVNGPAGGSTAFTMSKMAGLTGIVSVQTGTGLNLVKNSKGEYWLWEAGTHLRSLQQVTAVSGIERLTLDLNGLVAVKKDGSVWTWQRDGLSGKLGFKPAKRIKTLVSPVSFAAGENSKYAVMKDGSVYAWGTNMFGQLGISVRESKPFTPTPVLKPVNLIINGKSIRTGQPPIYLDGHVMVPLRATAESLGYKVIWDLSAGTTKLIKDGQTFTFKDGRIAVEGGSSVAINPPTFKVSYTEMVPAGMLATALGLSAQWDSFRYQLTLGSAATPAP